MFLDHFWMPRGPGQDSLARARISSIHYLVDDRGLFGSTLGRDPVSPPRDIPFTRKAG
jgi:hypothetical protein